MKVASIILIVMFFATSGIYVVDKILPGFMAEDIGKADKVVVMKSDRNMFLMKQNTILKQYDISLGGDPLGHKIEQGDSRTPEGQYVLDWKNPKSRYHLSIHISYPNGNDKAAAQQMGTSPGGDIMIHGQPNWLSWLRPVFNGWDWTDGCIAVGNTEMEEIWRSIKTGTPIEIMP